jgi:hypothetical protein
MITGFTVSLYSSKMATFYQHVEPQAVYTVPNGVYEVVVEVHYEGTHIPLTGCPVANSKPGYNCHKRFAIIHKPTRIMIGFTMSITILFSN